MIYERSIPNSSTVCTPACSHLFHLCVLSQLETGASLGASPPRTIQTRHRSAGRILVDYCIAAAIVLILPSHNFLSIFIFSASSCLVIVCCISYIADAQQFLSCPTLTLLTRTGLAFQGIIRVLATGNNGEGMIENKDFAYEMDCGPKRVFCKKRRRQYTDFNVTSNE
jgi:hypothetical protein